MNIPLANCGAHRTGKDDQWKVGQRIYRDPKTVKLKNKHFQKVAFEDHS